MLNHCFPDILRTKGSSFSLGMVVLLCICSYRLFGFCIVLNTKYLNNVIVRRSQTTKANFFVSLPMQYMPHFNKKSFPLTLSIRIHSATNVHDLNSNTQNGDASFATCTKFKLNMPRLLTVSLKCHKHWQINFLPFFPFVAGDFQGPLNTKRVLHNFAFPFQRLTATRIN